MLDTPYGFMVVAGIMTLAPHKSRIKVPDDRIMIGEVFEELRKQFPELKGYYWHLEECSFYQLLWFLAFQSPPQAVMLVMLDIGRKGYWEVRDENWCEGLSDVDRETLRRISCSFYRLIRARGKKHEKLASATL